MSKQGQKKKSTNDAPLLTMREVDILRWVQEGKTNEEIGAILGRTKWTVKFHLKNVMKKLNVTSRTQAVSQAIGKGIIVPIASEEPGASSGKIQAGVVGCGKGGAGIMEICKDNPTIDVIWAADKRPDAPGVRVAAELGIPVLPDYNEAVKSGKAELIFNVTGSDAVKKDIEKILPAGTELMGGLSARIMWQLVEERRRRVNEREKVLKQHEALYHLGLVVESIDSLKDAAYAIVDYATKLTDSPAGSLAIFDDKAGEMMLAASKGFSNEFKKVNRWEIRKGGLTGTILNHQGPLGIEDLRERPDQNPVLLKEGIRSILAAPLVVERRIVGILYANDFRKRKFRSDDLALFS
ncbi:MAG: LuxR C-terminal-related transcriptional regulator, partial [Thermodesulfobacteriota bacterium]